MISAIKDFLEFFYANHQMMWDNIVVFAVWGLLCAGLGGAAASVRNREMKRRLKLLKQENDTMKRLYSQLDPESRFLAGAEEADFSPSAEEVSKQIQRK